MLIRLRDSRVKAARASKFKGLRDGKRGGKKSGRTSVETRHERRTRCSSQKRPPTTETRPLPDDKRAVQAVADYLRRLELSSGGEGGMSGVMDLFLSRGDAKK